MTTYRNTAAEAERIGWNLVPEHCEGDSLCQFVRHDIARGKFVYTNDPVFQVKVYDSIGGPAIGAVHEHSGFKVDFAIPPRSRLQLVQACSHWLAHNGSDYEREALQALARDIIDALG